MFISINHCLKIFLVLVRTSAGFKMYVLSSLYVSSLHSHQFSSESAILRVSQPAPSSSYHSPTASHQTWSLS